MTAVRSTLRAETRKAGRIPRSGANIAGFRRAALRRFEQGRIVHHNVLHEIQPETGILKYANAGHNWALLSRCGRVECVPLDADGLVLGVQPIVDFEEKSVKLSSGDTLLLYTDGVIDAQNARGEFFGFDRLCASFNAYMNAAARGADQTLALEVR